MFKISFILSHFFENAKIIQTCKNFLGSCKSTQQTFWTANKLEWTGISVFAKDVSNCGHFPLTTCAQHANMASNGCFSVKPVGVGAQWGSRGPDPRTIWVYKSEPNPIR